MSGRFSDVRTAPAAAPEGAPAAGAPFVPVRAAVFPADSDGVIFEAEMELRSGEGMVGVTDNAVCAGKRRSPLLEGMGNSRASGGADGALGGTAAHVEGKISVKRERYRVRRQCGKETAHTHKAQVKLEGHAHALPPVLIHGTAQQRLLLFQK
jgi:hypothetical protein